jgi:uncharacterized protein (DUF111 family)
MSRLPNERRRGMKLLNFSIGKVQAVRIGGEVIRTAHVKAPAPAPPA